MRMGNGAAVVLGGFLFVFWFSYDFFFAVTVAFCLAIVLFLERSIQCWHTKAKNRLAFPRRLSALRSRLQK